MTVRAVGKSKEPRSVPRRVALVLAALVWLVGVPAVHGVVPWALSLVGPRYGWHDGTPAGWNLVGLVPVSAGALVLLWVAAFGLTGAATMPERVDLNWRPKILLTRGPYGLSRHPMYVGELALWLGWAILYGSPAVLAAFVAFCIGVGRLAPREERDLESTFGDEYRDYANVVSRWLSVRARSVPR
jgi:protein-S-isoprenylcysteine O-methyltransferase Ste14